MCQILSFLPQTKLSFEVKHTGGAFKINRVRIQVLLPPSYEVWAGILSEAKAPRQRFNSWKL